MQRNIAKSQRIEEKEEELQECRTRLENKINGNKEKLQEEEIIEEPVTKIIEREPEEYSLDQDAIDKKLSEIIDIIIANTNNSQAKKSYKEKVNILLQTLSNENKDVEDHIDDETREMQLRIAKALPNLTKAELRIGTLLCMEKSTKEIAEITDRKIRSIDSARARLRKSLGLNDGEDIKTYILSILSS